MSRRLRIVIVLCVLSLIALLAAAGWQLNVTLRREQATTALVAAVKRYDTPAALDALSQGADPNVRDDHDSTPKPLRYHLLRLWNAMRGRPLPPVKETGRPMLGCALEEPDRWDVRLVKALLDKGANPNLAGTDPDGEADTPLLLAIEKRVGPEWYDDKSLRKILPLSRDLAALLLAHGADPNMSDKDGCTPLYATDDFTTVRMLFAHGACVFDRSAQARKKPRRPPLVGWNPDGDERIALELLRHGADVNEADLGGRTPLMRAAEEGNVRSSRLLIEHGAKVNLRTEAGSALLCAATVKKDSMVRFLLALGADPNSTDAEGKTALMEAAETGDAASVRILLQAGADVNVRNNDKTTALQEARAEHHTKVCLVLRAAGTH